MYLILKESKNKTDYQTKCEVTDIHLETTIIFLIVNKLNISFLRLSNEAK